ncbi:nucleoside-diphosphate sugar epimerase [Bacillus cereus group sp. BfR-BA-01309]|uniref:nucleoside-diphosphate sugar epimerase n=1 Tax=Bacillus cereus group sp. BfR-BA-01309 TaxID=2920286 RepID=UPI001F57E661|nr:nucleoside-diphosphate sugar epimerase [Bacillus cereus group sp. BfR-BA-01309]
MQKKKRVEELKCEALLEVQLIKMEYEQIIEKTQKEKKRNIQLISDENLKILYTQRKDRKYAALTIELYSLVEQFLKNIYSLHDNISEYKKKGKVNTILDLQGKLDNYIEFKNITNAKILTQLRNYIIHDTFSLKQARKKFRIKKKNKELYSFLLETVEEYISNMLVK